MLSAHLLCELRSDRSLTCKLKEEPQRTINCTNKYVHLFDLLSTPFLPVFGFSFPVCCNLVWFCAWSLDDLLPLLLPFTTMFLDSPSHFIPPDSLTQLHLVSFQKARRSGWIISVPIPTGRKKIIIIRTSWETCFQDTTFNTNNKKDSELYLHWEEWKVVD